MTEQADPSTEKHNKGEETGRSADNGSQWTPKERLEKIRENQEYFSSKISELARYIGFGLVAVSFTLLSSSSKFSEALLTQADGFLVWAGLLGVATVLADYIHLLFGWLSNNSAARNSIGHYRLSEYGKLFRFLQDKVFFYMKQFFPLIGAFFLLLSISKVVQF